MSDDYDLVLIAPKKSPRHSRRASHGTGGHSYTTNVTTVTVADGSGRMMHVRNENTHFQSRRSPRHDSRRMPLIREDGYDSDSSVSSLASVSSDEDVGGRLSKLSLGGRSADSRSGRSATRGHGQIRQPYREEQRYIEAGNSRSRHTGSQQPSSRYSSSGRSDSQYTSSRVPSSQYSSSRPTDSRHGSSRPSNSHSHYPTSRPTESRHSGSRHSESKRAGDGGEHVIYEDRVPHGGYSTNERKDKSNRGDSRASKSLGVVKYLAGRR